MMKIALVHNGILPEDGPDATDVLDQAEAVREAIVQLGHQVELLPCSLNLEDIASRLKETKIDLVFNLVESLGGHGRLIHLFPSLLDAMRLRYTGSSTAALGLTSNKTEAKKVLRHAELPTPDWFGPIPDRTENLHEKATDRTWIVKSLWEHASLGMDAESLVKAGSAEELFNILHRRADSLGGECFAEHYIDGREFNISLLHADNGPQVLPPAEIIFENFTPQMVRIVDYNAKWNPSSFAYNHTPRTFNFDSKDAPLLEKLHEISRQCWHLFKLNGYARVDFRVDHDGRPWILEVNANPCLSPDAGFSAALVEAGLSFNEAIRRILEDITPTSL